MSDQPPARHALVQAAKRLLPERAPSAVTGRELAAAAGVNYGLIHHYFGGKDAVFREALLELRAEFLSAHEAHDLPNLVIEPHNPYLRAVGRSQIDYPNEVGPVDDFPIGESMVAVVRTRVREANPSWTDAEVEVEARARVIAMLCMQLGYGLYREMLLATAAVSRSQQPSVEQALARIYREVTATG